MAIAQVGTKGRALFIFSPERSVGFLMLIRIDACRRELCKRDHMIPSVLLHVICDNEKIRKVKLDSFWWLILENS